MTPEEQAEAYARAMGAVGVTVRHERRLDDGTLVIEAEGSWQRDPETVPDGDQYEWRCFGTITCEPMLDQHGRECEKMNDEARHEFYAMVCGSEVAELVEGLL